VVTLRDPDLERALAEDGYVRFPLLDADQVAELIDAHRRLAPDLEADGGMAFDYLQEDRSTMRAVTELVRPLWDEVLPDVFVDHRVVFSTFVIKRPGPESSMFLHDDRTFVDESQYRAHTLWVALDDTSPELDNGCLHLVPGSHRITDAPSGSGTPHWIADYHEYLSRFVVPVPAAAGDAVLYDSRTLHGSPVNRTDRPRHAMASAIAPRQAQLTHVVAHGDLRRTYAVDASFFIDHHPHAVERSGMPSGYALLDERVEQHPVPAPEWIAAVCDPGDVPVPQSGTDDVFAPEAPAEDQAAPVPEDQTAQAAAPPHRSVARRLAGRARRLVRPS
jgi:hypothetical protein